MTSLHFFWTGLHRFDKTRFDVGEKIWIFIYRKKHLKNPNQLTAGMGLNLREVGPNWRVRPTYCARSYTDGQAQVRCMKESARFRIEKSYLRVTFGSMSVLDDYLLMSLLISHLLSSISFFCRRLNNNKSSYISVNTDLYLVLFYALLGGHRSVRPERGSSVETNDLQFSNSWTVLRDISSFPGNCVLLSTLRIKLRGCCVFNWVEFHLNVPTASFCREHFRWVNNITLLFTTTTTTAFVCTLVVSPTVQV